MYDCKQMPVVSSGIKQFDSIAISCCYTGLDGAVMDLSGVSIASQIRTNSGALVCDMVVSITDAAGGLFTMRPSVDRLPVGRHNVDVLFSINDQRVASETFTLTIDPAVTAPP